MNINFSEEDIMFRNEVRNFIKENLPSDVRNRIAEGVVEDKQDIVNWQKALHTKGWLAPNWPNEYGGCQWSATKKYIFEDEVAKANSPRVSPFGVTMVGPVIIEYGNDKQKSKFLPRILNSQDWWCQGYSEPNSGSDLASLSTKANKENGKYIVNGTKTWITNGVICNYVVVAAYTNKEDRKNGISIFIVDKDTPGFQVSRKIEKLGHRSSDVAELVFENCELSEDALLGGEEGKFQALMETLIAARISHGVKSVGLATAAFEYALAYSKE